MVAQPSTAAESPEASCCGKDEAYARATERPARQHLPPSPPVVNALQTRTLGRVDKGSHRVNGGKWNCVESQAPEAK